MQSGNSKEDEMSTENERNFIPRREADFDGWFENLTTYVAANALSVGPPPRWTHIPQAKVQELQACYNSWHAAWLKMQGPHTDADLLVKDQERARSEAFLRPFIKQYLRFPPVTDEDRVNMGIHNENHHHTRHGKIEEMVESSVDTGKLRTLIFRYHITGAAHHHKMAYMYGMEGLFVVTDTAPTGPEQFNRREVSTANPLTVQFREEDRGKKVFYMFRWIGTREGMDGDWSEIRWAIIP
jgi:hypothetical protein